MSPALRNSLRRLDKTQPPMSRPVFTYEQRFNNAWLVTAMLAAGYFAFFVLVLVPMILLEDPGSQPQGKMQISTPEMIVIVALLVLVMDACFAVGAFIASALLPARVVKARYYLMAAGLGMLPLLCLIVPIALGVELSLVEDTANLLLLQTLAGAALAVVAWLLGLRLGLISRFPRVEGFCLGCGYDLRYMEGGEDGEDPRVCPECGRRSKAPKASRGVPELKKPANEPHRLGKRPMRMDMCAINRIK